MEEKSLISELRQYRIKLDSTTEFLNTQGKGIALFDLIGTFIIAYFLYESFLKSVNLPIKKEIFYLSLIPIGILIHGIIKQDTFLNIKLMEENINIYKIILVIIIGRIIYLQIN